MVDKPVSLLVVDDQPENLRSLSGILQQRGYLVRQAINGRTALKTVSSQPPDLILLDIRMPHMDGYAVCSALKQNPQTSAIPIIFLSALDDLADKVKAFEMGGVDYITKPFQVQEVLARINYQLQIRQQQQQLTELYQQVQHLNVSLEQEVQMRTLELRQALEFETTLKHITDRVRDSLDETQILQAAIQELTTTLQAQGCDIVLYHTNQATTMSHRSAHPDALPAYGINLSETQSPELYAQLAQKIPFALCDINPDVSKQYAAMLICPIWDERSILGTLWLFKPLAAGFSEQEISLVQQVANHCAIALRQSRFFQAAQAQIDELQRLNQLKDDFLSTISHELRTPVANIQMAVQLIKIATNDGQTLLTETAPTVAHNKVIQYFKILQEECEREIHLIQDLLDLQHLEAGTRPLELSTIRLNDWLAHVLEVFELRANSQHQQLHIQIEPDLPPLTTDLTSLSRILTELLNNAYKYTPPDGTITIKAHLADLHDDDPRTLNISVINSGITIPATELPRVFDKFYRIPTTDPWKHGGTGLGLALVKKLVEHLQGVITVTSNDHIIRFTLRLPLCPT